MEKMPAGVAELGMVIQHTGYNRCPYSNHEGFEFENFAGFAHFRALSKYSRTHLAVVRPLMPANGLAQTEHPRSKGQP
jgi:hypothetical protein